MKIRIPKFPAIISAVMAGAVCANALLFQEGPHPTPLFGAMPASRKSGTAVPRATPVQAQSAAPEQQPLILDLQKSLHALGYYAGALDGRFGPQTQAGIIAYQRAHALAPTGVPSSALLEHSRHNGHPLAPLPPEIPRRAHNSVAAEG